MPGKRSRNRSRNYISKRLSRKMSGGSPDPEDQNERGTVKAMATRIGDVVPTLDKKLTPEQLRLLKQTTVAKETLKPGEVAKLENSILILTDSYKFSHYSQYPVVYQDDNIKEQGLTHLPIHKIKVDSTLGAYNISYFEARGTKFKLGNKEWSKVAFFGLQYYIKKYLDGPVINLDDVKLAQQFVDGNVAHGVFPLNDWQAIALGSNYYGERYGGKKFDDRYKFTEPYDVKAGHLPIIIEALQEGTVIDVSRPLFKITNTHPRFYWLPNYLETLLVQVWYSMTVCTSTFAQRCLLNHYTNNANIDLDIKAAPAIKLDCVDFLDFGFRGVSSVGTAALGSLSYLAAGFIGSDTPVGVPAAIRYYKADVDYKEESGHGLNAQFIGSGVPASEHSTITSWSDVKTHGPDEFTLREKYAWMNQLIQYGLKKNATDNEKNINPSALTQFHTISFVIDGYNTWNAVYNQFLDNKKIPLKDMNGNPIGDYSMLDCIEKYFQQAMDKKGPPRLIVLRPDSGDANLVLPIIAKLLVAGLNKSEIVNYPRLSAIRDQINKQIENSQLVNFKVLTPKKESTPDDVFPYGFVILQGDGVEPAKLPCYLNTINYNGFDVGTFRFGSGGGLLQKINRDTFKCAFKCCAMAYPESADTDAELNVVNVQKNPLTSMEKREDYNPKKSDGTVKKSNDFGGDKKSKSGWLNVIKEKGQFIHIDLEDPKYKDNNNSPDLLLKVVFKNGDLVADQECTLLTVRNKINEHLQEMMPEMNKYQIQDKNSHNFKDLQSILNDIKASREPTNILLYKDLAKLGSKWFDDTKQSDRTSVFTRAMKGIYDPKNTYKDCGGTLGLTRTDRVRSTVSSAASSVASSFSSIMPRRKGGSRKRYRRHRKRHSRKLKKRHTKKRYPKRRRQRKRSRKHRY